MSKPITVSEALRLIELAREVDGGSSVQPWIGTIYRDQAAIVLWRASYGALLEYLREWIENDKKDCHGIGRLEAIALAPLVTWADAHYLNWRSPR